MKTARLENLPSILVALARAVAAPSGLVFSMGSAAAQDMEPRRWTHLPVGTDVLGVAYVFTAGDVAFDPVLRLVNTTVDLHTVAVAYNHYFGLLGTTARVDVLMPFQSGHWEGVLDGQPVDTTREGPSDPIVRLSAVLFGAPAMREAEFFAAGQRRGSSTVVGTALAVRVPLGDYDSDKLINLGQNRFAFEPQLGVVHTRGPWSYELTGSVFLYTANEDFFGGNELEQEPLFAAQAHVVRTFESRWWVSGGAAYGWNGSSDVNGESKDDDKSNLLYGLSFGVPLGSKQGLKLAYMRADALEDIGTDSHNLSLGWSIRF